MRLLNQSRNKNIALCGKGNLLKLHFRELHTQARKIKQSTMRMKITLE